MQTRKGYADGRWGQVHYTQCGEGLPLVLVHQSPTDSVQFARAMAPLAERGLRAIAIDIPGFGGSDAPDAPPTMADYAHIVPAVLDALEIPQAAVCGHHTGAVLVTEAALQCPSRISKVVLHGPLPMDDAERVAWRQRLAYEKEWNLRWDGSHLAEAWARRRGAQPAWSDIEAFHANFVHGLLAGSRLWYAHDAVMTYAHEAAMAQLGQPTLILANTGDVIYPYSKKARELYPHFAYAELEGGTIDCIDEMPEAWAEAVAAFIKA